MQTATWRLAAISASVALGWGASAAAQSVSSGIRNADAEARNFKRDRGVTVRERPHPEYEPIGARIGGLTVLPRLQLDFERNDNILARDQPKVADTIVRVRPELAIRSGWSRHAANLFARATSSKFADTSSESTTDWTAGGSGRLDVGRMSNLSAGVDTGRFTESRTSNSTPQLSRSPIRYRQSQAFLSSTSVINRMRLITRLDRRKYDFRDGVTQTGLPIEQDDRDRTVTSAMARADYAVSPAVSFFVQGTASKRDYKTIVGAAPPRDSKGQEVLVGSSFELGALIRAEAAVGYVRQAYRSSAYRDIKGFGARGEVVWMPTQLTTVTFNGSRTVEDTGIVNSAGYLSSNLGVQVDHELLRNLILTAAATYGRDEFKDFRRTDKRRGLTLSGAYLLNRNLSLTASYNRSSRDAEGVFGQNYKQNRFAIAIVAQF